MPENRLASQKSPYLLQHAHNPVDWYPWGDEAFAKAKAEDKPIFLSVGYSTCHWCHVMERESFENDDVARVMNELFVNVKVDREERPDVDRVYMAFVQGTTGSGGWPMSVWLTPDLKPFYGGTYYPPEDRFGRPGFVSLCKRIAQVWREKRDDLVRSGDRVIEQMRQQESVSGPPEILDHGAFDLAFRVFRQTFDEQLGGFGKEPKFPRPVTHNFLLRHYARGGNEDAAHMVLATLWQMSNGGMCDHLGGGFHRYSVDRYWHVPHFEKMLYDQAQLAVSYLEAYQVSRDELFARVARETCDYVLRDLTDAQTGAFYSAEDADSLPEGETEKREGAFYVFTRAEVERELGESADLFCRYYGIQAEGNADDPHGELTGKNILHITISVDKLAEETGRSVAAVETLLAEGRARLKRLRDRRPRPHLDDKVLASWNGMMIGALARAHQVLDDPRYLEAATRAAEFAASTLWIADEKRLERRWRQGEAAFSGYLDDYAQLCGGLIDLYEASFDLRWLRLAEQIADAMLQRFHDAEAGGFFSTEGTDPSVLLRLKDDYDGAEPAGSSIAAQNLLRLAHMIDRDDFARAAHGTIRHYSPRLKEAPHALPQMLCALGLDWEPPIQLVVAGERDDARTRDWIRAVHGVFSPTKILLLADSSTRTELGERLPWLGGMTPVDGAPALYVCKEHACDRPVTDLSRAAEAIPHRPLSPTS